MKGSTMRDALMLSSLTLILALPACERPQLAATQASSPSGTAVATRGAAPVARIVFLDKEDACDCTRQRIAGTWAALQAALGTPASLPVERIHVDTQAALAQTYTLVRPLLVAPGVYLLDANDAVIDVLQGEVTSAQIAAKLEGR